MNDIHDLIAAAKLVGLPEERACDSGALLALHSNAIAMAEALARIEHRAKYRKTEGHFCDSRASLDAVHDIARNCLDKIVKEAK